MVVLKNPSTADATLSDQTANQVCNCAYEGKFGRVIIVNLFAYRSKDKSQLKKVYKNYDLNYVVGPYNDQYIQRAMLESSKIIVAWGAPPDNFEDIYNMRIKEVHKLLADQELYYIDKLWDGRYPLHAQIWPKKKEIKDYRNDCLLHGAVNDN